MMEDIIWLPAPQAAGYEVSSDGRVRSIPRVVNYKDGRAWRFDGQERAQFLVKGYRHLSLSVTPGIKTNFYVHLLVCEAFHGPRPSPMHEARHLNGNPFDNRVENLAWGTKKDNAQDSIRHGTNNNLKKTRCKYGHPFSYENTHVTPHGYRMCRICMRRRGRAYDRANRVEISRRNRERLEKRAAEEGRQLRKRRRTALTELAKEV